MKTALLVSLLLATASVSAHAITSCSFEFGELQSVGFYKQPGGKYAYGVITNSGSQKSGETLLDAGMFARNDITFPFRGVRYHVFIDGDRGWRLETFYGSSTDASDHLPAYCK